jgi:diguanylate cyclase (GGDEF)-like protein
MRSLHQSLSQHLSEREIAINRIAATISHSKSLDPILQTAATEVGRALSVRSCVVYLSGRLIEAPKRSYYFRPDISVNDGVVASAMAQVERLTETVKLSPKALVSDCENLPQNGPAMVAMPLIHERGLVGILTVESDDTGRVWSPGELLLLRTVSDQLVVALKQAHLSLEMETQALTDALTGFFNRRSFEIQLERDLHLATRMRQPFSLIILDLDGFRVVNDRAGHDTGDVMLQMLAQSIRSVVRAVDTTARFGADEFAIILPQASIEGARIVAERLRRRIEETEIPGYGSVSASFGFATFPTHASSRDTIVAVADRALYQSRNAGGNCICGPPDEDLDADIDETGTTESKERLVGALSSV